MNASVINNQPYSNNLITEKNQPSVSADLTKPPVIDTYKTPGSTSSVTTSVSYLARQLSAAATQAEGRDSSLTMDQKRTFVGKTKDMLLGESYNANKANYDRELPTSDSPDALDLAKRATQFTNGSGKNPFSGMSRDKLALMAYDESGNFTVNERRAALYEAHDQEYAWRKQVVAEAHAESSSTGKLTNFFKSVLDHYQSLPSLEQSQYPDNYVKDLNELISKDFNYKTNQAEGTSDYSKFVEDLVNPSKK